MKSSLTFSRTRFLTHRGTAISLVLGMVISSYPNWSRNPSPSYFSWKSLWAFAVCFGAVTIIQTPAAASGSSARSRSLVALGAPKPVAIYSVKDFGLPAPQKPTAYYIGQAGCGACQEGLSILKTYKATNISNLRLGPSKSDSIHDWTQVPNPGKIYSAPVILFVVPSETVVFERVGMSTEQLFLKDYFGRIEDFLTDAGVHGDKG